MDMKRWRGSLTLTGARRVIDRVSCLLRVLPNIDMARRGCDVHSEQSRARHCAGAGVHLSSGGDAAVAQYLLVLDALNFCFWPQPGLEYEHLARGLKVPPPAW